MKVPREGANLRILEGNGWIEPCYATFVKIRPNREHSWYIDAKGIEEDGGWWIKTEYIEVLYAHTILGGELL